MNPDHGPHRLPQYVVGKIQMWFVTVNAESTGVPIQIKDYKNLRKQPIGTSFGVTLGVMLGSTSSLSCA